MPDGDLRYIMGGVETRNGACDPIGGLALIAMHFLSLADSSSVKNALSDWLSIRPRNGEHMRNYLSRVQTTEIASSLKDLRCHASALRRGTSTSPDKEVATAAPAPDLVSTSLRLLQEGLHVGLRSLRRARATALSSNGFE